MISQVLLELLKHLDEESLLEIQNILNVWYENKEIEKENMANKHECEMAGQFPNMLSEQLK